MEGLVLVTGGTRGLGLAIAKCLSDSGFEVIIVGRRLTDEAEFWLSNSSLCHFESFDFEKTDSIHAFSQLIVKKYGRIYGLVNNAAIGLDGVLATMHESDISRVLKVNVEAPILLTKYMLRSMLINRKGRVINISSIIGHTGFSGLSVYAATKAALNGFTKSLAREVGKVGITVNSIAPGYMATDMTGGLDGKKLDTIKRRSPMGKLTSVEDVAHTVNFLMGGRASMITGSIITVDGGSTA